MALRDLKCDNAPGLPGFSSVLSLGYCERGDQGFFSEGLSFMEDSREALMLLSWF